MYDMTTSFNTDNLAIPNYLLIHTCNTLNTKKRVNGLRHVADSDPENPGTGGGGTTPDPSQGGGGSTDPQPDPDGGSDSDE